MFTINVRWNITHISCVSLTFKVNQMMWDRRGVRLCNVGAKTCFTLIVCSIYGVTDQGSVICAARMCAHVRERKTKKSGALHAVLIGSVPCACVLCVRVKMKPPRMSGSFSTSVLSAPSILFPNLRSTPRVYVWVCACVFWRKLKSWRICDTKIETTYNIENT